MQPQDLSLSHCDRLSLSWNQFAESDFLMVSLVTLFCSVCSCRVHRRVRIMARLQIKPEKLSRAADDLSLNGSWSHMKKKTSKQNVVAGMSSFDDSQCWSHSRLLGLVSGLLWANGF